MFPCWFVGSYGIVQAIAATTGRLFVRIQVAIQSPRRGSEGGVAIYYTTPQKKEGGLILCHSLEKTRETNYDTNYYD
jgi:hypothetical protein